MSTWCRPPKGAPSPGCASWWTAPTARPCVRSRRAGSAGGDGHRTARHARRHQHQRAVRLDGPGELAREVTESGADLGLALDGDEPRHRRRPHRKRGRRRCPPGVVRPRPGQPGSPGPQHRGGDRHDQPGIPAVHGVTRHRRPGDRRGRPPRAGCARRGRPLPGWRAVRPHHLPPASTTGDGILTGIALADLLRRSGRPLRDLAEGLVERVPRCCSTCRSPNPGRVAHCAEVSEAVQAAEAELGHQGRVLLPAERDRTTGAGDGRSPCGGPGERVAAHLASVVESALGQVGG